MTGPREPRTAEEWAEQVDRELVAIYYDEAGEKKIERLAAFFRLAMAQARAEEREACACRCETERDNAMGSAGRNGLSDATRARMWAWHDAADTLTDRIRARGKP